jgi:hypothetical protein
MKDNHSSKADFESEGLAFGAGAMSETSQMNATKQKRKTIFIKLHPKPSAPRHGAAVEISNGMKNMSQKKAVEGYRSPGR